MEQQTISIAKAGIQATLNARTSILAAANPINGRYDRQKSLKANVAMSPPIMSRFDLFFVVVDECDEVSDYNIARHIVSVHQRRDKAVQPKYSTAELQRYIKFARTIKPRLTKESSKLLSDCYRELRKGDGNRSSFRITVRQLESMIRLSEALARLYCEEEIKPKYVREAFKLLEKSIVHVEKDDVDLFADDEEHALDDADGDELPSSNPNASQDGARDRPSQRGAARKPADSIRYEKYVEIANVVAVHLRRLEQQGADAMRRSEVISWYLDSVGDRLTTKADLEAESVLAGRIIDRLITRDNVLVRVTEDMERLYDTEQERAEAEEAERKDPLLLVHPNYEPTQL